MAEQNPENSANSNRNRSPSNSPTQPVTSILEIITLMRIEKSLYSILAISPKEFPTA
jgi:hypothetical protein